MHWPRELYLIPIYFFSRVLPRPLLLLQNRLASYVTFRIWRAKHPIWQKNISVILERRPNDPIVKRMALSLLRNYGLYLCDYVLMYRLLKGKARHLRPVLEGMVHIDEALAAGKGAVLVTPHLGHWELGGVHLSFRECRAYALTLRNPEQRIQIFRDKSRGRLGIQTIHIEPERFETILKLARLLRENCVIIMLGDRWEGGKKVSVRFFGQEVVFPVGAAALALATGAPLIPVYTVLQANGRYLTRVEKPIRVERVLGADGRRILEQKTQELARVFEAAIRRYPDQWYHFFDYWEKYKR